MKKLLHEHKRALRYKQARDISPSRYNKSWCPISAEQEPLFFKLSPPRSFFEHLPSGALFALFLCVPISPPRCTRATAFVSSRFSRKEKNEKKKKKIAREENREGKHTCPRLFYQRKLCFSFLYFSFGEKGKKKVTQHRGGLCWCDKAQPRVSVLASFFYLARGARTRFLPADLHAQPTFFRTRVFVMCSAHTCRHKYTRENNFPLEGGGARLMEYL